MTVPRGRDVGFSAVGRFDCFADTAFARHWIEVSDAIFGLGLQGANDDGARVENINDAKAVCDATGLRTGERVLQADPAPGWFTELRGYQSRGPVGVVEFSVAPIRGLCF